MNINQFTQFGFCIITSCMFELDHLALQLIFSEYSKEKVHYTEANVDEGESYP